MDRQEERFRQMIIPTATVICQDGEILLRVISKKCYIGKSCWTKPICWAGPGHDRKGAAD
jgi:hypothetical protein